MSDRLGYRCIIGLVLPSVNTIMQPECEALRMPGISNQVSRFYTENVSIKTDKDFDVMMENMIEKIGGAIDMIKTCNPNHIIVGVSTDSLPNASSESLRLKQELEKNYNFKITMATDACVNVANKLNVKRLGIISPYTPESADRCDNYFSKMGFEIINHMPLAGSSPSKYAETTENEIYQAIDKIYDESIDAFMQVGTNLSTAFIANEIEHRYQKPFISVNTACFWNALRTVGIYDQIEGFGQILAQH